MEPGRPKENISILQAPTASQAAAKAHSTTAHRDGHKRLATHSPQTHTNTHTRTRHDYNPHTWLLAWASRLHGWLHQIDASLYKFGFRNGCASGCKFDPTSAPPPLHQQHAHSLSPSSSSSSPSLSPSSSPPLPRPLSSLSSSSHSKGQCQGEKDNKPRPGNDTLSPADLHPRTPHGRWCRPWQTSQRSQRQWSWRTASPCRSQSPDKNDQASAVIPR